MMSPAPPAEVIQASQSIDYRSMILVYLTLPVGRFTPTDAHYFPEADIRITRLSEPKNYFGVDEPRETTTLCAELPCNHDDEVWNMADEDLGRLVMEDLRVAQLPGHKPLAVFSRRLPQAYPIYTMGYQNALNAMDSWVEGVPNMLVFGRQGLFAHDNTHHTLFMAYCAARCLQKNGRFDQARWDEYRKVFTTHVVED
jgi:protoporphyrinogen oxidase